MKKQPNPVDKHVGQRIRMRRMMLSMSQEKLGDAIGITFQQIQKYERGANRVGASRLQQIADILQAPPAFFFEGAPQTGDATRIGSADAAEDVVAKFLSTPGGLALARAWTRIDDHKSRAAVLAVAQAFAGGAVVPFGADEKAA